MQKESPLIYGSKPLKYLIIILIIFLSTALLNAKLFNAKQLQNNNFNYNFLTESVVSSIHMGYGNTWAQLLWIKVTSYFGEHLENSNFNYIAQRITLITTLNPKSEHAYYMAASLLPWNTQSTKLSRPLLKKAIREFPNNWLWPYYIGFNAYWFDHDLNTAAIYLNRAASLPNVHPVVSRLALRMLSDSGQITTAIMFLENQIKHARDPHIKSQLQLQHTQLATEKELQYIESLLIQLPETLSHTHMIST